jgi:hypothetical protein
VSNPDGTKPSKYRPAIGTPLDRAFQAAKAEMLHRCEPGEKAWLAENPLLWLRALHLWRDIVKGRMHMNHQQLKSVAPAPGESDRAYSMLVRHTKANNQRLEHQLTMITVRREELKTQFGLEAFSDRFGLGDMWDLLVRIHDFAEDEKYEAIISLVNSVLDKLEPEMPVEYDDFPDTDEEDDDEDDEEDDGHGDQV